MVTEVIPLEELIDRWFAGLTTSIAKDLKVNLKRLTTQSDLNRDEAMLAFLALAQAAGMSDVVVSLEGALKEFVPAEEIVEAKQSAAMMGMLTTYYRFRHMVQEGLGQLPEGFANAGLRMTSLARPVMGKRRFEMMAFALAVFYGCPSCVVAHDRALRAEDVSESQIHDLARLAAVVQGFSRL
ncbi:MAG: carboxymuconolactone decarboxylase family protein [Acidobacteria bacterium]|nr:carboxymuconolactone decarboxylase family protein [Acidobacteriota bacterium]